MASRTCTSRQMWLGLPTASSAVVAAVTLLASFACVSFTLPTVGIAASFDCAKVETAMERAICADAELSALDQNLQNSYAKAMRLLSNAGKTVLRDGQRRWLHHASLVCFDLRNDGPVRDCLMDMYERRLKELNAAAVQVGPFLFSRVDYYFASPDPNSNQPFQGHTAYPRIDQPMSEVVSKWNSLMAPSRAAEGAGWCDGSPGDVVIDFTIRSATTRTISVQRSNWMYCHGTPHGYGATQGKTYVLSPALHELVSSELFSPEKSWDGFLADRCYTVLKQKEQRVDRDTVKQVVTRPNTWALARDGLIVTVDPYEVLGYASGTSVILIPWAELAPFLAPDAPRPD
jgi:uncharacterized protein